MTDQLKRKLDIFLPAFCRVGIMIGADIYVLVLVLVLVLVGVASAAALIVSLVWI
jgi:hypothetical protein